MKQKGALEPLLMQQLLPRLGLRLIANEMLIHNSLM